MKRWREDDKCCPDALGEGGRNVGPLSQPYVALLTAPPIRFRWVFCQLDTLQQCLPSSVRQMLDELPESLDETYERIVMNIKEANRAHADRMLQCLVLVAIRPLSVAELAELLAFEF
jgi:hypothetical protein